MANKKDKWEAIPDEAEKEKDAIGYEPYIKALTKTIVECKTPLTIGLHGVWGKGKTSTMWLIKNELDNNYKDEVVTVFYNPWEYQFDARPIVPLLHAIRRKAVASTWYGEKGYWAKKNIRHSFEEIMGIALHIFTRGISLDAVLKMRELYEQDERKTLSYSTEGETIKGLFESTIDKLIGKKDRRVVIFIDDLDRCLPEYALKILEAIKLYLSVEHCVFVIGVEKEIIEKAIKMHYKLEKEDEFLTGRDYLEKIIQLPYNLPDMGSKGVETLLNELLKGLNNLFSNDKEKEDCIALIKYGINPIPRTVKRFINSIILQKNIADRINFPFDMRKVVKLQLIYYINERLSMRAKELWKLQDSLKSKKSDTVIQKTLKEKYRLTEDEWSRLKYIMAAEPSFEDEEEINEYLHVFYPEELKVEEEAIKNEVGQFLEELTKKEVKQSIEELDSKNPITRTIAARNLCELGDKSAVPKLIELLEDEDEKVRRAAAEALGKLGDKSAVPKLIELLEDEDGNVKEAAAEALGKLGDRSAVSKLIEILEDKDPGVRRAAAWALGELGDKSAVSKLIELLRDKDEDVRRASALALGELGDKSAVPKLTELLKDEDPVVRMATVWALEKLGY